MALVPIRTVSIPCLVLDKNKHQFNNIQGELIVGAILNVECRNLKTDAVAWWAIPQKDYGIFTELYFEPQIDILGNAISQPTFDTLPCFRIQDKITDVEEYFIYGTIDQWYTACATCCDDSYTPMPGIDSGFPIRIAPTVVLGNITDDSGNYLYYTGLPTLAVGYNYFPYGSYENVAFPNAPSTGFADIPSLLVWLNANAHSVGSPSTPLLTWTVNAANDLLIATGGNLGDEMGLSVVQVLA